MQNYKNPIFRKAVEALETLMIDSVTMIEESENQRDRYNSDVFDGLETARRLKWQKQYEQFLYNELPALKAEAERIDEAKRSAALNLDGCEKEIFLINNSDSLTEKDIALLAKKHPDKHLYLSALVKYAGDHQLNAKSPEIVGVSTMASQAKPRTINHGEYLNLFTRHLNRMRGYESTAAELKIYQAIDDAGCFAQAEKAYFNEQ